MALFQELSHLNISLDCIKLATNNFSADNSIGMGGFGRVYKGKLSDSATNVAVKRLDTSITGQGQHEFLQEIVMLASCKHENLVTLVGFTDEGNEKILVYKYEVNGSLDKHLAPTKLTWEQRLRICLGAARGLAYLHDDVGPGHRVLHRDIKSSNILLDENWEAKISDFGLSKIGPAKQNITFLATNACGTLGYLDPEYMRTGILTKESDVYSFGVVMFEVLCGRFAIIEDYHDERRFLFHLVKCRYEQGKLGEIIVPDLLKQMKPHTLETFSKIAYQCLNDDRKKRPKMSTIVQELEIAINHQIGLLSITQSELWGSKTGGEPWSFVLNNNLKLKKITIDHDRWIYSIRFHTVDLNGTSFTSKVYGGNNGPSKGRFSEINFDDDEEIIGISGTTGNYVRLHLISSLCFTTNKKEFGCLMGFRPNKKKYGPYGHETSNRFSKAWDVGLFAGFYGRSGFYLDGIGCYFKSQP